MGHYDSSREGYCGKCGAAPGNIKKGVCEFCGPKKPSMLAEDAAMYGGDWPKETTMRPAKAPSVRLGSGDYRHDPTPPVNSERERCAQVCESLAKGWKENPSTSGCGGHTALSNAAVEIRRLAAPPVIPTDDEIAAWADGFIQAKAFNRPIAIQIAVEAAKWVRAKMQQPR